MALIPAFVVDFLAFHALGLEASIEVILDSFGQHDFYEFWLNREFNRRWLIVSFDRAKKSLAEAQVEGGYSTVPPVAQSETYEGKRTIYKLAGKFVRIHKKDRLSGLKAGTQDSTRPLPSKL